MKFKDDLWLLTGSCKIVRPQESERRDVDAVVAESTGAVEASSSSYSGCHHGR